SESQQGRGGQRFVHDAGDPDRADRYHWGHAERCAHVRAERGEHRHGERQRGRAACSHVCDDVQQGRGFCASNGAICSSSTDRLNEVWANEMIIVLMGVAGSGKTTVGTMLAETMKCSFLEGDSLHSKENIDKMSHGIPLTDADRAPWLAAIHLRILDFFERGQDLIVGCSALKLQYRRLLAKDVPITWVYLKGTPALIRARLR